MQNNIISLQKEYAETNSHVQRPLDPQMSKREKQQKKKKRQKRKKLWEKTAALINQFNQDQELTDMELANKSEMLPFETLQEMNGQKESKTKEDRLFPNLPPSAEQVNENKLPFFQGDFIPTRFEQKSNHL